MDAATARKILIQNEPADLYDTIQPVLKDKKLREEVCGGKLCKERNLPLQLRASFSSAR